MVVLGKSDGVEEKVLLEMSVVFKRAAMFVVPATPTVLPAENLETVTLFELYVNTVGTADLIMTVLAEIVETKLPLGLTLLEMFTAALLLVLEMLCSP